MNHYDLHGVTTAAVKLDRWGCYVWLSRWKGRTYLMNAEQGDYENGSEEAFSEVTAPDSQEFLDAVNLHFGTDFRMDQFAGR